MKRILSLMCAGSMVFALSALAAPDPAQQKGKKGGAARAHAAASAKGGGAAMRGGGTAHVRAAPARMQRSVARAPARGGREFTRNSRAVTRRSEARTNRAISATRMNAARQQGRNDRAVAAARERQVRGTHQNAMAVAPARERGFHGGTAWRNAQNRNIGIVNTWRSNRFSGSAYAPFRNYNRVYHDRGWYHSHYGNSLVFVLGGWWYWNSGYWYPAWGYSSYGYYPYDGPVYTGYASLTPDRVAVQVQRQLQRDGYYAGPIDGSIGPMTRRALAAFQADNGLAVTSAIDQPTLSMLGIS